jgi:hypothetical protein
MTDCALLRSLFFSASAASTRNTACYTVFMPLAKTAVQLMGCSIFIALVASAIYFLAGFSAEASPTALTKTYSNPAWGFALKMPADFSAYPPNATPNRDETGAPTGQAIVLQNKSGAAVQIQVTPDSREVSNSILTEDDMARLAWLDDPSEAEPIQIAPGVIGMTFTDTKHPSFGNATKNVWFAYRGNLYAVTADAKDGALSKAMMATWTFL